VTEAIHVTEAEGEVLAALWRCGPLTPPKLMREVKVRRPWTDSTIKTLLSRLIAKKAVRSERDDGRLQYRALLERDAYVEGEVRALVDRLFEGDAARLVALLAAATKP
jgi:BlaI family penicillinase repressor